MTEYQPNNQAEITLIPCTGKMSAANNVNSGKKYDCIGTTNSVTNSIIKQDKNETTSVFIKCSFILT
jgi:hypothetical protein